MRRGATLLETALVLPLLVSLILFSGFIGELSVAKLKVHLAARFAAWELTSYPLSAYANADHRSAFDTAHARVAVDIDSLSASPTIALGRVAGALFLKPNRLSLKMFDAPAPGLQPARHAWPMAGPPLARRVLDAMRTSESSLPTQLAFNPRGLIRAEVSVPLRNQLLPHHFLDEEAGFFRVDHWGGRPLGELIVRSSVTVLADSWVLRDGADAVLHRGGPAGGHVAGAHRDGSPHPLLTQVRRMSHLGQPPSSADVGGLKPLLVLNGTRHRDPFAESYVVSHNYGLAASAERRAVRRCDGVDSHQGSDGLNNLATSSAIDFDAEHSRGTCFDTAPFRDRTAYRDSSYAQVFMHRGPYFMGCPLPEASDPSAEAPRFSTDRAPCGANAP